MRRLAMIGAPTGATIFLFITGIISHGEPKLIRQSFKAQDD